MPTSPKRVLAIHDLCSFGRCSLTAAIPVISAMGVQVCPFPTAWFSNNLTYGSFHFTDFTAQMASFMDKWQALGLSYDALYSGFLADAGQIAVVKDALRRFASKDTLMVVDPAMGDDGELYPVFSPDFVDEMRSLVAQATVTTPNFTEACLLLGIDPKSCAEVPGARQLRGMLEALLALGARQAVITSVPAAGNRIKVASLDGATGEFFEVEVPRIDFSTCGTGDLFTSVLTGALLRGASLAQAAHLATTFASDVIEYSRSCAGDRREGVALEPRLGRLIELLNDAAPGSRR